MSTMLTEKIERESVVARREALTAWRIECGYVIEALSNEKIVGISQSLRHYREGIVFHLGDKVNANSGEVKGLKGKILDIQTRLIADRLEEIITVNFGEKFLRGMKIKDLECPPLT